MNDTDLANACVALGVGAYDAKDDSFMWPPGANQIVPGASAFVRDWRVAGALMEKCLSIKATKLESGAWYAGATKDLRGAFYEDFESNQSKVLPRAFIEACCEALA